MRLRMRTTVAFLFCLPIMACSSVGDGSYGRDSYSSCDRAANTHGEFYQCVTAQHSAILEFTSNRMAMAVSGAALGAILAGDEDRMLAGAFIGAAAGWTIATTIRTLNPREEVDGILAGEERSGFPNLEEFQQERDLVRTSLTKSFDGLTATEKRRLAVAYATLETAEHHSSEFIELGESALKSLTPAPAPAAAPANMLADPDDVGMHVIRTDPPRELTRLRDELARVRAINVELRRENHTLRVAVMSAD